MNPVSLPITSAVGKEQNPTYMTIRPLRDLIVAVPIESTNRVGALYMPDNSRQALRTHFRAKVLASGPLAQEHVPVGSIISVSQSWGETDVEFDGQKAKLGRARDINAVLLDE